MRVALINTPTRTYAPNYIMPLGIMYLASCLEKSGHIVKILDIAKSRQSNNITIRDLHEFSPDLIGLSGIITAFRFMKILVRDIKKEFTNIPVVIGGHIVLDNYDMLFKSMGTDYAVTGYGEKPILDLVEYLEKTRIIEDVAGLSYLKNSEIVHNSQWVVRDMDSIPLPAYHHIDMEHYITAFPVIGKLDTYISKTGKPKPPMRCAQIMGTRGCTDQCSFCVHEFGFKGFLIHSMDYIINNIRYLYKNYDIRIFMMGEDNFLFNLKQAREFADAMNTNFPDAYFTCSVRANYIVKEGLLDVLKDSNCYALGYGFESGSDEMLNILRKRMTYSINVAAYKAVSQTNITPACAFMVGTPGETRETIKKSIRGIKEAKIVDGAVFFTTPYPGSRIFRWSVEQGLIKDVESYLEFVSNRDAAAFSINFTPFPDKIVKWMQVMVQNALDENNKKPFKIVLKKRFVLNQIYTLLNHWIIPSLYESYFIWRKLMAAFIPKYRKDTIEIKLNQRKTLKLNCDKDY